MILTRRQLNRTVLSRQLLLERADLPLPTALERIAGIQNQYAPNGYIGLWSRLAHFGRDDLTKALEERSVVQGTLMRGTIHLVSARDFWPMALAVREARREWWLRVNRGLEEGELAGAGALLHQALSSGPRWRRELSDEEAEALHGGSLWVDLVRAPPSGTWERRRADRYALAEQWIGPPPASPVDPLSHLISRYLAGFGPATIADIASFSGLKPGQVTEVVARMDLRRLEDEEGSDLLDLPEAPIADPHLPAPVRLLPTWDSTLLAHARRSGILPEAVRPLVFHTKNPPSVPTFLLDGQVAGSWMYEQGRIRISPFRALTKQEREAVEDECQAARTLLE